MARILNIETSTSLCSVTIAENGQCIATVESSEGNDHAKQLTANIDQALHQSGWTYQDLNAIAVSEGPGSYTGLRIGTSTAKGLCFALSIPLLAVPTLKSMAIGLRSFGEGTYLPILPSRKGEVYLALYDQALQELWSPQAAKMEEIDWQALLEHAPIFIGGQAAKSILPNNKSKTLTFIDEPILSSMNMARLSYESYQFKEEKSLIYFEPLYLKPVYITAKQK